MQTPPLNTHYDVSSVARDQNFGLSLRLHPYLVYASSEGSGSLHISTGSPKPTGHFPAILGKDPRQNWEKMIELTAKL